MTKRRNKPQDEAKHAAILKAATRLFLKQGFTSTSMDAVAIEARVTKQTVYAHYQSKDVLFTHMVTALCEKHAPSEALLKDANKPVEALLVEIGTRFLDMITSKEGLAATRLVIAEVQNHPKLAERYYKDGTQRMIGMLWKFLKLQNQRGAVAISDPASAASYFFSMLKGPYYLRMLLAVKPVPNPKEKLAHVQETVRIFMKIYGREKPMHPKGTL